MIEAVIFDLDGTLINSEPNYYLADKAFIESFGVEFTKEMHENFIGMGGVNLIKWLKNQMTIAQSIEDLCFIKDQYYLKYARKQTKVFPEMKKLLELLKQNEIPMAIATGSTLNILSEMVEITGIRDYFQHIVSSQEVAKGKPAPDVFLETAKRLSVNPQNCLV